MAVRFNLTRDRIIFLAFFLFILTLLRGCVGIEAAQRAPGFILADGIVSHANPLQEGDYFAIGEGLSISVPPMSIPAMRLRELVGQKGQLVFVPERTQQRIERD